MPANANENVIYLQPPVNGVSVIIPCKNEDKAVGLTVKSVADNLSSAGIEYEIIVVDDGSTDRTRDEALAAGAKVLAHPINMGYGNSIMDAMIVAKYPVIATVDADGTYPVAMLPAMIEEASKYDMVIGTRVWTNDNTSLKGKILRKILYYIILYFSNIKAPDYNSGFRVFHKLNTLDYRQILCPTFSFTTSLTILYLLNTKSIKFMKIEYSKRIGISKVSHLRDSICTFSYVFILTSLFQPYRLFLIIIFFGLMLNFMVILLAYVFNLAQSLQIGLHIMISLAIIVGSIAINTYSSSKKYLDQLHDKRKYGP